MNKHCFIVLLSCLGAAPALAGDPATAQEQQQGAEQTTPRTEKTQPQVSPPAAPASSFTPSEKVSADSAVSFPVDI